MVVADSMEWYNNLIKKSDLNIKKIGTFGFYFILKITFLSTRFSIVILGFHVSLFLIFWC